MKNTLIRFNIAEQLVIEKNPRLLCVGEVKETLTDYHCKPHKHEYIELGFLAQGKMISLINGVNYNISEGDIIIYNKGDEHFESPISQKYCFYYISFDKFSIKGFQEETITTDGNIHILSSNENTSQIGKLMKQIFAEAMNKQTGFESVCEGLLLYMFVLMVREVSFNENILKEQNQKVSQKAIEYINKKYNEDISLEDIAKGVYISKHYLCHIFQNEVGFSPISYLIRKRIDEAKKLLVETNDSITDIAVMVGYENTQYFSILFKKVTGISPKKYRTDNKI